MRCQEACSENRSVSNRVERKGAFTEEETELVLAGGAVDGRVTTETRKKLVDLDMIEYQDFLDRNLGVLLR